MALPQPAKRAGLIALARKRQLRAFEIGCHNWRNTVHFDPHCGSSSVVERQPSNLQPDQNRSTNSPASLHDNKSALPTVHSCDASPCDINELTPLLANWHNLPEPAKNCILALLRSVSTN